MCRQRRPSSKSLRDHGLDVPSSCETGTCGTCRTKMLAGEADHRDLVLAEQKAKEDTIMILRVPRERRRKSRSIAKRLARLLLDRSQIIANGTRIIAIEFEFGHVVGGRPKCRVRGRRGNWSRSQPSPERAQRWRAPVRGRSPDFPIAWQGEQNSLTRARPRLAGVPRLKAAQTPTASTARNHKANFITASSAIVACQKGFIRPPDLNTFLSKKKNKCSLSSSGGFLLF